ncbi:forkhead box protein N3-like isoform X2 [Xyrauchen texanus]|uniref:forkhead box protein N3-like isoform X2 n=1 Tax=Xyrauchen texanus TaxID=154827 RepID=UPI0022423FC8|nr:forkhead box protein N3-like isoform X2 [Xyrauchen texanus]
MGPVVMPPGKKAEGPSSGSVARGLSQLYQDTEAADLSFALSASLSRAEDEELTSLSWLHESTDLLTTLGHSGLRSVSPLQDANGSHEHSSSSPSSSPEPSDPPYHLSMGPSRKPPYSFSCLIFMAIEDAPSKRLPVKDIYGWILEHFPYFASAPTGWKNSVRHNLSLNKCFKKVDKDRSQTIGKGSLWSIDPDYRHNLIQALKKTPYHPYSPRLPKPSTSPSASLQQYHRFSFSYAHTCHFVWLLKIQVQTFPSPESMGTRNWLSFKSQNVTERTLTLPTWPHRITLLYLHFC